jgi:hypothetical protein
MVAAGTGTWSGLVTFNTVISRGWLAVLCMLPGKNFLTMSFSPEIFKILHNSP